MPGKNTPDENTRQRRIIHYGGRVQGVGFRYTVRDIASRLAVVGFVRNLPDGRVQLEIEGEPGEIDRLLEAIRAQMGRNIAGESEQISAATDSFERFEVRF